MAGYRHCRRKNLVFGLLMPRRRPEPGTEYPERDFLPFSLPFSNGRVNRIASRPAGPRTGLPSRVTFGTSFFGRCEGGQPKLRASQALWATRSPVLRPTSVNDRSALTLIRRGEARSTSLLHHPGGVQKRWRAAHTAFTAIPISGLRLEGHVLTQPDGWTGLGGDGGAQRQTGGAEL